MKLFAAAIAVLAIPGIALAQEAVKEVETEEAGVVAMGEAQVAVMAAEAGASDDSGDAAL